MMNKLKMLDPCGAEVNGVPTNVCKYFIPCEEDARKFGSYVCVSKMAWQMADYLLGGSNIEAEKRDMKDFLKTGYGKRLVDPRLAKWESMRLSKENIDEVVEKIAQRAQELCSKVNGSKPEDKPEQKVGGFRGFRSGDPVDFYCSIEDIIDDLNK